MEPFSTSVFKVRIWIICYYHQDLVSLGFTLRVAPRASYSSRPQTSTKNVKCVRHAPRIYSMPTQWWHLMVCILKNELMHLWAVIVENSLASSGHEKPMLTVCCVMMSTLVSHRSCDTRYACFVRLNCYQLTHNGLLSLRACPCIASELPKSPMRTKGPSEMDRRWMDVKPPPHVPTCLAGSSPVIDRRA